MQQRDAIASMVSSCRALGPSLLHFDEIVAHIMAALADLIAAPDRSPAELADLGADMAILRDALEHVELGLRGAAVSVEFAVRTVSGAVDSLHALCEE